MSTPSRVLTASRTLTAVKGKALYHDGLDDYVQVPDDPSLDITDAITIEAWVKPNDITPDESIVGHNYREPWRMFIRNGVLSYGYRLTDDTGEYQVSSDFSPMTIGNWYYVAVTHNFGTGEVVFYQNEVSVSKTASYTGTGKVDGNVEIGRRAAVDCPFNGTIALVRIYERALSAAEVLYNKEHPYNPVLHGCVLWLGHDSIDEGAGIWRDKSGYNNDGVVYGATAVEMNKLAGRVLTV